jgi:hypothetical protein
MLRKFSVLAIAVACSTCALAQDSTKKSNFVISGSADVYARYNFNNPKITDDTDPNWTSFNNKTSFTNTHNTFALGMASIKVEHSIGKVGMVADLGFGKRAEEFSYNDANTQLAVKQLYLTYAATDKIKFTIGSWGTHVGYELVDAYLNRNYSMSYMFSYGPFFHTGLKADINLGGTSALMVGVTNPTDFKSASTMPKMIIGQFSSGTKDGKLKLFVNYQGGKFLEETKLQQGDVVLTYAASSKFSLGYNGTLQSRKVKDGAGKWGDANSWWGSALYLNLDPVSWFGLTLRTEYVDDHKSVVGINTKIIAPTLSANFKIDNLTIIPEFRFDNAKDKIWLKSSSDLTYTKTTGSFILAATYHF